MERPKISQKLKKRKKEKNHLTIINARNKRLTVIQTASNTRYKFPPLQNYLNSSLSLSKTQPKGMRTTEDQNRDKRTAARGQ